MYIMSFAMLFFSVVVLTMAYNVSSIKKMFGEGNQVSTAHAEFCQPAELTAFMSIKPQFPDGSIKDKKGKTFEERYAGKPDITNETKISATLAIIEGHGAKTDLNYCEKFWELNGPARYEISLIAADNFKAAGPSDGKYSRDELFSKAYANANFSASMMALAIGRGEVSFALDAATAHLLFSKAVADCFVQETVPIKLNYLMPMLTEHENVIKQLFLTDNACFHTAETVLKLAKTLEKRVRFIDAVPTFKESVENESKLIKKAAAALPVREKLTLGILELWYGDAHEPYHELARELSGSGKTDYASIIEMTIAAVKKYPHRRTFNQELANSGDGIIPMIKFAWFAVNTNPLAANAMMRIPINMLFFIARADARFRLVTLGGLARFFYYENGRWPDLSKDSDFVKKAGRSAVDPYTGALMRCKNIDGGALMLYCHWKDGINTPAESETTEIEVTAMPPDVKK